MSPLRELRLYFINNFYCCVVFQVILVSHSIPFFPSTSGIVMTEDGGESWRKIKVPFQISGPLLFHPHEENWILARAVVNGMVRRSLVLPVSEKS